MLVNGRTLMSLRAYWEERCATSAQAFRNALGSASQETISAITETFEQAAAHVAAVRTAQAVYNTTITIEAGHESLARPSLTIFAALVLIEQLDRIARLCRAAMNFDSATLDKLLMADRARDYSTRVAALRAAITHANQTTLDMELPDTAAIR